MPKRDLKPWLFGTTLLLVSFIVLYLPVLFAWSARNEMRMQNGKDVMIMVQFGRTMGKLKVIYEPLVRFHGTRHGYAVISSSWKHGYYGVIYEMIFAPPG